MTASYRLRTTKVLRVFCPVDRRTVVAMASGDATAIEQDETLARMLAILRDGGPLGDFGVYKSVAELAVGWELFTPQPGADPTVGEPGVSAASPTVVLTTYFSETASPSAVDLRLQAIMDVHPWETPVIELTSASLLERATVS